MLKSRWVLVISCFCLMSVTRDLRADVKPPQLISDGVVLQQGMKVNLWGWADPGEQVSASIQDQQATAVADSQGRWQMKIGPLRSGGPFSLTISGKNTIVVHDVLVGEVWVCSGQSNMEMPVAPPPDGWSKGALNYELEITSADYPTLRMFTVHRAVASKPQVDVQGNWVKAHGEAIGSFSATAYFFGRDLQRALNVPVGLIHSSWGGTIAEAWTSRGTLESDPEFKSILENGAKLLANYPKTFDDYEKQLIAWREESERREAVGKILDPPPALPKDPRAGSVGAFKFIQWHGEPAHALHDSWRAIWYQG